MRAVKVNKQKRTAGGVQALLDSYLSAYEYRYDPDTVLLEPDSFKKRISCGKTFAGFLANVRRHKNIVFYAPVGNQTLVRFLSRRGFQQHGYLERIYVDFTDRKFVRRLKQKLKKLDAERLFSKHEFIRCRATDHPGVSFLLREYLLRHRRTFLDVFGTTEKIFQDVAEYHYFEGRDGKPLAFNKGIRPATGPEAEITYGRGTARQNIAMILYTLLEEYKRGTPEVEINVPYERVAQILLKLGMESEGKLAVMIAKKTPSGGKRVAGQRLRRVLH